MDRTELFLCQCHDVSHQLVLSTFDDDDEKNVYCSFHLDNYGLWRRIKSACLYLFGNERKDGDFDPMIMRPEDSERLSFFLDYLHDTSNDSQGQYGEGVQIPYEENNAGRKWRMQQLFSYDIYSQDNIHRLSITKLECVSDPDIGTSYEAVHTVMMKKDILPVRLVKAIRHIWGYRSCYGDFDSYTLTPKDVSPLRTFIYLLETIDQ